MWTAPGCRFLPLIKVSRSVDYVQSGTAALQDAKQLQRKTRKWMCCAIILLLVTAAVIVIVVRAIGDGSERNVLSKQVGAAVRKWCIAYIDLCMHACMPL